MTYSRISIHLEAESPHDLLLDAGTTSMQAKIQDIIMHGKLGIGLYRLTMQWAELINSAVVRAAGFPSTVMSEALRKG